MKKYLLIAFSTALLFAFFACGSPKEEEQKKPDELGDLTPVPLTLPATESKLKTETGEGQSLLYKLSAEDAAKVKGAVEGSLLEVTYTAKVNYAIGEMGWIDKTNAGPILMGKENNKQHKNTVYFDAKDLVFGTDGGFTVHIFNGAELLELFLYAAPEGYTPKKNPNASENGIKIVIPQGAPINGNGDISKVDFKKITTAASGNLVFYFDVGEDYYGEGILKFGPKSGDPYKHFGIDSDGAIYDESGKGWRRADDTTHDKIVFTIAEINAAVAAAPSGKGSPAGAVYNKFEINIGKDGEKAKGELLYIEIIPE